MARYPILMAVCGKRRIGKSHKTTEIMRDYVRRGRKVLIFDVTNEYSDKSKFPDIKAIALKDVPLFAAQTRAEIRRVAPFFDDGRKMTLDDMVNVLNWILSVYFNGLLLVEDINKYIADTMTKDVMGAMCTLAHQGVDLIMQFQSIGRLTTKVWQNINVLRMHKNTDSVDRHRGKFEDKYEYLKVAEILVNEEYRTGNVRFFLHVNFDDEKIIADLPEEKIRKGIEQYMSENYRTVTQLSERRDGKGKRIYSYEAAFKTEVDRIYNNYFRPAA